MVAERESEDGAGSPLAAEVKAESRWPAAALIALAIAVHLILPARLIPGPRLLLPAIEAALLAVLMIANPYRLTEESRDLRILAVALTAILNIATIISLGVLVDILMFGTVANGRDLIRAGFELWLVLILGFGLSYWEMDRGGPLARTSGTSAPPDFLFPQMSAPETAPDWRPRLGDYP